MFGRPGDLHGVGARREVEEKGGIALLAQGQRPDHGRRLRWPARLARIHAVFVATSAPEESKTERLGSARRLLARPKAARAGRRRAAALLLEFGAPAITKPRSARSSRNPPGCARICWSPSRPQPASSTGSRDRLGHGGAVTRAAKAWVAGSVTAAAVIWAEVERGRRNRGIRAVERVRRPGCPAPA